MHTCFYMHVSTFSALVDYIYSSPDSSSFFLPSRFPLFPCCSLLISQVGTGWSWLMLRRDQQRSHQIYPCIQQILLSYLSIRYIVCTSGCITSMLFTLNWIDILCSYFCLFVLVISYLAIQLDSELSLSEMVSNILRNNWYLIASPYDGGFKLRIAISKSPFWYGTIGRYSEFILFKS